MFKKVHTSKKKNTSLCTKAACLKETSTGNQHDKAKETKPV